MAMSLQFKIINNKRPQVKIVLWQKNDNHFVQKFLTKDGIETTPNNEKLPNNKIVLSNNPSPMFHPQGFKMQKVQTPFQGNSSDFSNLCDSPDFMDTLAK